MAKSSPERRARREHAAEAFIVNACSGCGRLFILRGRVTPVAECASEDEADARVQEMAQEYQKRNPASRSLAIMTEEMLSTEPLDPDDDASLH